MPDNETDTDEINLLTVDLPPEDTTEASDIVADTDVTKPDLLPEKFWDAKAGEVRLDALIKSYLMLEQKLSQMLPAPKCDADRMRIYRALGQPEKPEDYLVDVSHGLFTADDALNARLHARGFTSEQVQEVYDLAAEKLVPLILDVASEFQADRELDRLIAHFGGPAQWQETARQLLRYGRKNLAPDVLKGLSSSYEGVMALYRLMQAEGSGLNVSASGAGGTDDPAAEAQKLMRDPKYWRDRDPATIAKVTSAFEDMYG